MTNLRLSLFSVLSANGMFVNRTMVAVGVTVRYRPPVTRACICEPVDNARNWGSMSSLTADASSS